MQLPMNQPDDVQPDDVQPDDVQPDDVQPDDIQPGDVQSTARGGRRARPAVIAAIVVALALGVGACGFFASSSTTSVGDGERTATDDDGTTTDSPADEDGTTAATEATDGADGRDGPIPATFWAIDATNWDLVEVDSETGEEVSRVAGYGPEIGAADQEAGPQRLVVAETGAGLVWVGDCCEPAVGSLFGVDPDAGGPVFEAAVRISGTFPTVSPDGTLLATQQIDFGVAIVDAATGETVVGPEATGAVLAGPEGASFWFPTPLAWIDDATLVVAAETDERSTITIVSLANPSAPAAVGQTIDVEGSIIDGAMRAGGELVLAVAPAGSPHGWAGSVEGLVFSTTTGAQTGTLDLPDGTTEIDSDRSGRFLLVSADETGGQPGGGTIAWIGATGPNDLATGLLSASW